MTRRAPRRSLKDLTAALAGAAFVGLALWASPINVPAEEPARDLGASGSPLTASPPVLAQRIVSLDYCADQYAIMIAGRDAILALSTDADAPFSYHRREAAGIRQVRPRMEDVLALRPDLVIRTYGGGPGATRLLARSGTPVLNIAYADDIETLRAAVRGAAAGLGRPARGEAIIAAMDERLASLRPEPARGEALYITAGGAAAGPGTLVDAAIRAAGLQNFETEPGWRSLPLERLAYEGPALFATGFFDAESRAANAWSPARNPVVKRRLSETPTLALDAATLACGAWFIADAVEALAGAAPRASGTRP